MILKTYILILKKQFFHKWGRFLLSSGGIMIGIWAITLTTSLSLGVSDAFIKAINSQTFARQIQILETEDQKENIYGVQGPPVFRINSIAEAEQLMEDEDRIVDYIIDAFPSFYVQNPEALPGLDLKCVEYNNAIEATLKEIKNKLRENGESDKDIDFREIDKYIDLIDPSVIEDLGLSLDIILSLDFVSLNQACNKIDYPTFTYNAVYENNKKSWIGSKEKPKKGEIAVCFDCGVKLGENLGFQKPEDMLNQTITIEIANTFEVFEAESLLDVADFESEDNSPNESIPVEVEVIAVIDDTNDENRGIFSSFAQVYLPQEHLFDSVTTIKPGFNTQDYGAIQYNLFVDDFSNTEPLVDDLRDQGYLVVAISLDLISGITQTFDILLYVLSGFGFIALIASVFGIINVMTISVLERKKEIGILKSIGAKNFDIFKLFWLESTLLGLIGWILGFGLAYLTGKAISEGFKWALDEFGWRQNLEGLNLTEFDPTFPWWLILGTLAIAIFFTSISGLLPARKASKQNPVEVLRDE